MISSAQFTPIGGKSNRGNFLFCIEGRITPRKEEAMKKTTVSIIRWRTALLSLTLFTLIGFSIPTADALDVYSYTEHGDTAQVESPKNLLGTGRLAGGTTFIGKPNTGTWVHIPISAHWYIGDGKIPSIYAMDLRFKSEVGYPTVRNVHLREGRWTMRYQADGLTLYGDYSNGAGFNVPKFNPSDPLVLSFYVDFGPQVGGYNPKIHIIGARFVGDLD
jgi:hypothetical protein